MTLTMANDRMIQAIGRIEQALDRLEELAAVVVDAQTNQTPVPANDAGRVRAVAALRSLDSLITELKARG